MSLLSIVCLILFSFLCGAIPTGYLLLKFVKHQDIRNIGSGNIGSTNVRRAAGTTLSLITQVIDILKGLIPVAIALALGGQAIVSSTVALAAILGHDFSPFLRFRGGKGVNTTIGSFLLLAPIPGIAAIAVYFALRLFTSIVSVRSVALGLTLAVMTGVLGFAPPIVLASWIAALLIILRHTENIQRLLKHNEPG